VFLLVDFMEQLNGMYLKEFTFSGDYRLLKHYQDKDFRDIDNAKSFSQLNLVAMNVLSRINGPTGQVCGPITTGGFGNVSDNLKVFERTILQLVDQDKALFNQVPFEKPMQKVRELYGIGLKTDMQLLEDFYLPIFDSGIIDTLYFINGWESSRGSRWEREMGLERGFTFIDLPKGFVEF